MSLDPKEVLQWLRDEAYVIVDIKQKFQFTPSFYEAIKEGKITPPVIAPSVPKGEVMRVPPGFDWPMQFMKLIQEAQVPARLEDNRGNPYYCNKYNEKAMKVFRKAIESGIQYPVLVKSVMLYYKSSVKFKKAIGNYFIDGDWMTDYVELTRVSEQGEEAITNHLKEQTKHDTGYTPYSIG